MINLIEIVVNDDILFVTCPFRVFAFAFDSKSESSLRNVSFDSADAFSGAAISRSYTGDRASNQRVAKQRLAAVSA